jgi:hypothetical protein
MRWPLKSYAGVVGAVDEDEFFDKWYACKYL